MKNKISDCFIQMLSVCYVISLFISTDYYLTHLSFTLLNVISIIIGFIYLPSHDGSLLYPNKISAIWVIAFLLLTFSTASCLGRYFGILGRFSGILLGYLLSYVGELKNNQKTIQNIP
ncbi:hypothetical protein CI610_02156 [invertebrate metagenome]|uniref:Uncharacterized protein n=1 Tax=invertebrate metagenome TaxID=1711999 RepID=A0A2H9T6P6_9ZZZZ